MLDIPPITIQKLGCPWQKSVEVDVLRLDQMHPIVSGNKWFKLQFYLQEAVEKKVGICTFGGAYSNHIAATAFACKEASIPVKAFIRGEQNLTLTPTLQAAKTAGMELLFTDRTTYKTVKLQTGITNNGKWLFVPEGGYGKTGVNGAAEIASYIKPHNYTHWITACGTGTTLAGLASVAESEKVLGVVALKGYNNILKDIKALTPFTNQIELLQQYHFGGYAKYNTELIAFMNQMWQQFLLPTDFVYTAKTLFAVADLCKNNHFSSGSKVLFVHTGGLQGNQSLPTNTLSFQ
jgi:1-aminocyclopropane-1-carboxylate deaminase